MTATKRCTKCGKDLPLDAFRRDRSRKLGRFPNVANVSASTRGPTIPDRLPTAKNIPS